MNLPVLTDQESSVRWFFFVMAAGVMAISWVTFPVMFRGVALGLFGVQMIPSVISRSYYVDWIWIAFMFSALGAIISLIVADVLFRLKHHDKAVKTRVEEDPEHVRHRSLADHHAVHRNPAYQHLFPKNKPE